MKTNMGQARGDRVHQDLPGLIETYRQGLEALFTSTCLSSREDCLQDVHLGVLQLYLPKITSKYAAPEKDQRKPFLSELGSDKTEFAQKSVHGSLAVMRGEGQGVVLRAQDNYCLLHHLILHVF